MTDESQDEKSRELMNSFKTEKGLQTCSVALYFMDQETLYPLTCFVFNADLA